MYKSSPVVQRVMARFERKLADKLAERKSMVRAKFKVNEITRRPGWNGVKEMQSIKLSPVMDGSEENKRFFCATPSGSIDLGVVNADAVAQFELGREYYVDFTPAE